MGIYQERMKALEISADMERRGVTVNSRYMKQMVPKYRQESRQLGKKLIDIADDYGCAIELPKKGVNDSIRHFLLDVLKLEPRYNEKSKSGEPTLDKNAMLYYKLTLKAGTPQHTIIHLLTRKAKYDNALAYMNQYVKYWHPTANPDIYVLHPNLNMTGTDTLRCSSNNPNAQNIAKDPDDDGDTLRTCFGPGDDREWWSFDAKNVELRIPGYKAKQQEMIDLFEKPDEPPYFGSNHLLNFHTVYPDIWEKEIDKQMVNPDHIKKKFKHDYYQWCKNGGFAIQYNAGVATADKAFHRDGCHTKLKARFSKLEDLNQECIRSAYTTGYVFTLPDRLVDPTTGYPILCRRGNERTIEPTKPLNYFVQSTAMWITMRAMNKAHEILAQWRKEGFDAFITLQVHDELVIDMPKKANPSKFPTKSNLARVRILQEAMTSCGNDLMPSIPIPFGVGFNEHSWNPAYEIAF